VASQAGCGPRCPGLFGVVAGLQQAERALRVGRAWFRPRSRLKIKNSFSFFFIQFQTEFKLQIFVSKYPELKIL
jgi:hypothetical protein